MTRCLLSRTPGFLTLLAAVLLVSLPLPQLHAQEPSAARRIADLLKEPAEPQKKPAELKTVPVKPRPIAMDDIPRWRSARGGELSNDGQWFACRIGPAEGDGEVIVRQTRGDKEYKFPVGGPRGVGGPGESGSFGVGGSVTFSHDSKWCAFIAGPPAPTQKAVLVDLTTGEKAEIEGVRRLAFNAEASTWIALQRAPAELPTPSGPPSPTPVAPVAPMAGAPAERAAGSDLTLRELATGAELTLDNVRDWAFDRKGRWLALTIETRNRADNGVQLCDMTTAALVPLESAKASYTSLAWTDKGDALSALKGVDDPKYEGKLYCYSVTTAGRACTTA